MKNYWIEMNADFMTWFGERIANESLEYKLIALKEFKDNFYLSTNKRHGIVFIDSRGVTLSDEQVVTYAF